MRLLISDITLAEDRDRRSKFYGVLQSRDSGDTAAIRQRSAVWAKEKLKQILNIDADNMSPATIEKLTKRHKELNKEHILAILGDAEKEYFQRSMNGYALDGTENDKNNDFQQVRGLFEDNNFVKELRKNI